MFKRNRKIRQLNKTRNKIRTLMHFMLKNCANVPFTKQGIAKIRYYSALAIQHFCKTPTAGNVDAETCSPKNVVMYNTGNKLSRSIKGETE